MKYIYHHLGLGDHIICNGLVRHYREIFGEVTIFCKLHNYENIKYMFRDDEKIKILKILDDQEVNEYIQEYKIMDDLIKIGFGELGTTSSTTFDQEFYATKKIPFSIRYEKFHIDRDLLIEKKIMSDLNPENEKYIFTHNVDKSKIRTDLKIIDNPTNYSIFNLISLIENSEEVHLMESSIKCLINSYKMEKPKFFYHQYVRSYPPSYNTVGLNKFEIIN